MSDEQACLVAHNILNSLGLAPPAPVSFPPAYAPATIHCGTANLANTAPLPPKVLAALVLQLRAGSRSLLVTDAVSAEVRATVKPTYAVSMVDTRELSHHDLEDIVMNLRKQSEDDDRVFVFDEHIASMAEESDENDRLLVSDEHIAPMADHIEGEAYWRDHYEFNNAYDEEDALWLSAMAGIVSTVDETELTASVTKPVTLPGVPSITRDNIKQSGAGSIVRLSVSALRAC